MSAARRLDGMDAAVALIEAPGPEPAILLIRRADRPGDPWSGHWALPGGRREAGDADLLATCLREVAEEVGLALDPATARRLEPAIAGSAVGRRVTVQPFAFRLTQPPSTLRLCADEVASARWLPLRWITDPTRHHHGRILANRREAFPHLLVDAHPLWGFTYRLLCRECGGSR